ncbi:MAG: ribonuclease H family protein [Lachnospiraceae bacterium]|nr:ribonuclease H family protein [Lachnospiraceae bacterium]
MAKYFYAVRNGRVPGIYETWAECEKQVKGFKDAAFKKFKTRQEAELFINGMDASKADTDKDNYLKNIPQDTAVAYVDGSYNVATGEYGSGVILFFKETVTKISLKGNDKDLSSMRNVAGEIKASELAMKTALKQGAKKLIIHHDYEGICKWCTGEWKANKAGTMEYRELYKKYSLDLDISFIKVKAHSGDENNDIADRLAKLSVFDETEL